MSWIQKPKKNGVNELMAQKQESISSSIEHALIENYRVQEVILR